MNKIDELLDALEGPVKSLRAMREAAATIRALREALVPFAAFGEFREIETEGFCDTDEFRLFPEETWHLLMKFKVADFRAALEASHGREG